MARTVAGLFDRVSDAEGAVRELTANGFRSEDISYAGPEPNQARDEEWAHDEAAADGAAAGATGGALLGGIGGLLLGLGAFAIPGLGALAAAGPLVAALTGAGVGAGLGGVVGALTEAGVPEEEAHFYAEGVRRGGTLVMVGTDDDRAWTAVDILKRHGAADIDRRGDEWKKSGWSGWTGLPRYDDTQSDMSAREREPAVASSATLERPSAAASRIPDDTEEWESDFRSHFQNNLGQSGRTYDEYRPAYEYGYHAASDPRFCDGDWGDTESNIRQDWSTRGHGAWDDVKDAVRCGWSCGRDSRRAPGSQTAPSSMGQAQDTRGPFERVEDAVTGDHFDDKTGKRI